MRVLLDLPLFAWAKRKGGERSRAKRRVRENLQRRERYANDPEYREKRLASSKGYSTYETQKRSRAKRPGYYACVQACHGMLKRMVRGKDGHAAAVLGYGAKELQEHLEAQWEPWMSWDNYGKEWEIDHRRSINWLYANGMPNPKVINALSNLRPLPVFENRSKGARCDPG